MKIYLSDPDPVSKHGCLNLSLFLVLLTRDGFIHTMIMIHHHHHIWWAAQKSPLCSCRPSHYQVLSYPTKCHLYVTFVQFISMTRLLRRMRIRLCHPVMDFTMTQGIEGHLGKDQNPTIFLKSDDVCVVTKQKSLCSKTCYIPLLLHKHFCFALTYIIIF